MIINIYNRKPTLHEDELLALAELGRKTIIMGDICHLSFELETNITIETDNNYSRKDYTNVDWGAFKRELSAKVTLNRNIDTRQKIDEEVSKLTSALQRVIDTTNLNVHIKRALPDNIVIEIKRKNKARRTFQRHPIDNNRPELTKIIQHVHQLL